MIPTCPTHGKPMRPGKGGAYFCPSKMPTGEWCPFKAQGPPAPATNGAASPAGNDVLAAASLSFAAALFRGAGPEMADDAIALAIRAYSAMRGVA